MLLAVAVAALLPLGVLPAAAAAGSSAAASPEAAGRPGQTSSQQTPPALQAAIVKAKLTASDAAGGDLFGVAVAVDGDTAVIGASEKALPGRLGDGSAYVFVRSGPGWVQQAELTAFDGGDFVQFGQSVAVQGDTAVIGAPDNDGGKGAAYVFVRSGSTWTQRAELVAPGSIGRGFGRSVALAGDTAVVGAPYDGSRGAYLVGAAYVFVRSGAAWTQQAKLGASDGAQYDLLGWSVALDGDTAVVGAFGDSLEAGSAYVFVRTGATWTQQAKLAAPDGVHDDSFGWSVALDGDTAVFGAVGDDSGAGSAYVFIRSGIAWVQQAKLTAPDASPADYFGYSVAVSGQVALVGVSALLGGELGAAYTFVRSGTTWVQQAKLTAPDASPADYFGYSVAVSGGTAVVGAPLSDAPRADDTGAAYLFGL